MLCCYATADVQLLRCSAGITCSVIAVISNFVYHFVRDSQVFDGVPSDIRFWHVPKSVTVLYSSTYSS